MTSSIKKANNLNRANRPTLRRATETQTDATQAMFESQWDELVICLDRETGIYKVRTARLTDSQESRN